MTFKTNLSRLSLIGNKPIKIYFENKTIIFRPPSISLYLTDLDFSEFLAILKEEPQEFNDTPGIGFIVETKYEIIQALLNMGYKKEMITQFFQLLFPNLTLNECMFYVDNEELTNEEYEILLKILLVSCGEKSLDEFIEYGNNTVAKSEVIVEDPLLAKIRAQEQRLKEMKNKKEKKSTADGSAITIDQIVIGILYEFPSFSLEDIYNMNMFTLLHFWTYVGKVVDTQIQIIAAGNGLIKKFTYFIK